MSNNHTEEIAQSKIASSTSLLELSISIEYQIMWFITPRPPSGIALVTPLDILCCTLKVSNLLIFGKVNWPLVVLNSSIVLLIEFPGQRKLGTLMHI